MTARVNIKMRSTMGIWRPSMTAAKQREARTHCAPDAPCAAKKMRPKPPLHLLLQTQQGKLLFFKATPVCVKSFFKISTWHVWKNFQKQLKNEQKPCQVRAKLVENKRTASLTFIMYRVARLLICTWWQIWTEKTFCWLCSITFSSYCSYLLPGQDGGTSQI